MNKTFSQNLSTKNHFIEIDAFRGVLAVIILVHHYFKYIQSVDGSNSWLSEYVEYGRYTIHFFFVLSGLLIFRTLEKSGRPGQFIRNRFSRLYPAYWFCMTLTAIVITASPYYSYERVTTMQYLANLTMFQHWMRISDIDGVYWTLAVEMCFYLLIFLVFYFNRQRRIDRIGALWMAFMVAVYFLTRYNLLPAVNYYYYFPLLRNGNLFFAGILFYKLLDKPGDRRTWLLIVLTLGVHGVINTVEETFFVGVIYFILALFVFNKLGFLRNRVFAFLGGICYTLYLLHQYIGYEIINTFNAWGIGSAFLKIILTGALIIGMATAVTYFVERPAMKFLRRKLKKDPVVVMDTNPREVANELVRGG